jgi:hypothetical protein
MINFRNHPKMTEVIIPNKIGLSSGDFNNTFNSMRNLTISEFNRNDIADIAYEL